MPAGKDWLKNRGLATASGASFVAYSKMDGRAQERMASALLAAKPEDLKGLASSDFVAAMTKLYAELDYVHPFPDGNSRTLRSFTAQLAEAAGYKLDWERFATSPAGHDMLYIARDLAVNQLAKAGIEHSNSMMRIVGSMERLKGSRELGALLADVTRPSRAVAFEQLDEPEALKGHPELAAAYQILHTSSTYLQNKYQWDSEAINAATKLVVGRLTERLNSGEVLQFQAGMALPTQGVREAVTPRKGPGY